MGVLYRVLTAVLLSAALFINVNAQEVWTLEAAARRAREVAPEMQEAEAEVAAREGELTQAGSWPNPTVELRADDKLGQEDGRGGTDLTQLALSQPLPIRRLARQRAAAKASLAAARANLGYRRLLLEREVARMFHGLQLAASRRALVQERLKLVAGFPEQGRRKAGDPLVRYLTPLERRRLAILNEDARQAALLAEREYDKALIEFRAFLRLPAGAPVESAPLTAPATPPGMEALARGLENHPALIAARQETEAARAGIAVAGSQRLAEPALNVFRERDFLNGARREVSGVGVSVQIPLWNANRGIVDKAKAEAMRAASMLAVIERDARSRLEQAHAQLTRLLAQEERMRPNLIEPARELFDLTRRAFAAGEANILALVDANNTYFDARARHLELLQESALAAADLRLAAGQSIIAREATP